MPVHWIDAQTLWFPPAGKSESSTQLVDKITWRQYEIRCAYWETRTHNKKEAGNRAHEFRKKEEMDSIETTDSDIPLVSRQQNSENARTGEQTMPKPPSAPNVIYQIPRRKPPPSEHLVHLVRSKKRCQSPASDDEEGDPTWCQPLKKKMDNHLIIQQHRTPLQDGTSALNVTVCQDETSGLVPPQRDLSTQPTTIQCTTAFQETSSVTLHAPSQSNTPSTTAMNDVSTRSTPSSVQPTMTTMNDVSTRSTPRSVQPTMTTMNDVLTRSTPRSTTVNKDVSTRSTPSSVQPSMNTISETTTAVQVQRGCEKFDL
jgi:hypothetical protein